MQHTQRTPINENVHGEYGVCRINAKARAKKKKIRLAHKMYTGKRHRSVQLDDDYDDGGNDGFKIGREKKRKKNASCNCSVLCVRTAFTLSICAQI